MRGISRVHGWVVHHTFGVITGLVPVIHVLLSIFGDKDDRGREGSSPPLPPNRAGSSPAHGSPVVGFLIGGVSLDSGLWIM